MMSSVRIRASTNRRTKRLYYMRILNLSMHILCYHNYNKVKILNSETDLGVSQRISFCSIEEHVRGYRSGGRWYASSRQFSKQRVFGHSFTNWPHASWSKRIDVNKNYKLIRCMEDGGNLIKTLNITCESNQGTMSL